jgi:hypothetical protein
MFDVYLILVSAIFMGIIFWDLAQTFKKENDSQSYHEQNKYRNYL